MAKSKAKHCQNKINKFNWKMISLRKMNIHIILGIFNQLKSHKKTNAEHPLICKLSKLPVDALTGGAVGASWTCRVGCRGRVTQRRHSVGYNLFYVVPVGLLARN